MLGRMAILLFAGALSLVLASQVAYADQYIPIDEQFTISDRSIVVYLQGMNLASEELSNIHYDVDPSTVYWVRLLYQFENTGDIRDEGFVTPVLIDSNGNQYRFKENEPTTQWVKPHFRTGTFFLEIPVQKNATLTEIVFKDGTIDHSFKLTSSTVTPAPGTPTPSGTPAPGGASWHDCIPLIPFGMIGGIAAAGIVINRCGIVKC